MPFPERISVPHELRSALLQIAVATDVICDYRGIDRWRVAAVTAARFLLRYAAEAPDTSYSFKRVLQNIARLAERANDEAAEQLNDLLDS